MNDEELLGLRDDDLDPAERARLRSLLGTSEPARSAHEDALALGAAIRSLPGTGGPPLEVARAAIRGRRRAARWHAPVAMGSGLLAAAAAMLAILPTGAGTTGRNRGYVGSGLEVHLEAAAEGPLGVRALGPRDAVGADERVIFRAVTRGEGFLRVEGDGGVIWPGSGSWAVGTGSHPVGGEAPASYRPDDHPATVGAYVVWFCPTPEGEAGCVSDRLELRWGG
jgi:hypothetical protein